MDDFIGSSIRPSTKVRILGSLLAVAFILTLEKRILAYYWPRLINQPASLPAIIVELPTPKLSYTVAHFYYSALSNSYQTTFSIQHSIFNIQHSAIATKPAMASYQQ